MSTTFDNFKAYRQRLEKMADLALPKVIASTINTVAGAAHSRSRNNLRRGFSLRNQYTERSLRYWKASPKDRIGKINAVSGTVSPYLPIQEKGGTVRAKKSVVPIATKSARGGTKARVVLKRFRMGSMGSLGRKKGGKFFVANLRKKGVYYRTRKKLIMVQDLSFKSYRVRATGWHSKAVSAFARAPVFYAAFNREAKRYLGAASAP